MATGFHRNNGQLCVDGILLEDIAGKFGTPLYVYSAAAIEEAYRRFGRAIGDRGTIHYAVKANSNLAVLRVLARLGAGADIVSGGELRRVLKAGFEPASIIFSGVGKTDDEIAAALKAGIGQINAESESEIERVLSIAKGTDSPTRLALRINPGIAADTHAKISTGGRDTKFGIATTQIPELYRRVAESSVIAPGGLAVHIGSQIMDLPAYESAWILILEMAEALKEKGFDVPTLDLGGGYGIHHEGIHDADNEKRVKRIVRTLTDETTDVPDLRPLVQRLFGDLPYELKFEPGRYLVANAGALLVRVLHTKESPDTNFVIVDGAMNDLIRPTLYEARHGIEVAMETGNSTLQANIVGPVCETGDYLGLGHKLPKVERGDVLAVLSTGAYGAVMRSNYNTRPFAAEVMVVNGKAERISVQQTAEDLLAGDIIPAVLK